MHGWVSGLAPAGWQAMTPSPGWTVAHQIAHLAWVDQYALLAVRDADSFFPTLMAGLEKAGGDVTAFVDGGANDGVTQPREALVAGWMTGCEQLAAELEEAPADAQFPWFGGPELPQTPSMLAAARLMEWWAHGLDVAAGVGATPAATDRLKHVADVSVDNRAYAFTAHGLAAPVGDVRVELTGPAGQAWSWGPAEAADRVTGSALDFGLLMTQRINRADTALVATGSEADLWLDVGQAYAGPPGGKRARRG